MSGHRLRATTGDAILTVELDANRTQARVRFETEGSSSERAGGIETTFHIAPIDTNVVGVIPDGADGRDAAPLRTHVVAGHDTIWVFIDGESFTIDIEPADRTRSRRGSGGDEGLAAPMPATVIKVLVEPGALVKRGDVLLLLEAMKMELPIRAPREGRVKALHCRPGELVQPGTALVDLE
jgi:biotin carboxyl carrier protein